MKAGSNLKVDTEYVFYCPECDGIHVMNGNNAFVFDAGNGPFIHVFCKNGDGMQSFIGKFHDLYLIGEL